MVVRTHRYTEALSSLPTPLDFLSIQLLHWRRRALLVVRFCSAVCFGWFSFNTEACSAFFKRLYVLDSMLDVQKEKNQAKTRKTYNFNSCFGRR